MTNLFVIAVLVTMGRAAYGLRCYVCSSIHDPKCGTTWEVSESDAEKYRQECPEGSTACDKLVSDIQGSGVQHVYRKCWNQTYVENWAPSTCSEEDPRGGVACHCTADACNGQRPLVASIFVSVVMGSVGYLMLKKIGEMWTFYR